jgi:hypothetical protein
MKEKAAEETSTDATDKLMQLLSEAMETSSGPSAAHLNPREWLAGRF